MIVCSEWCELCSLYNLTPKGAFCQVFHKNMTPNPDDLCPCPHFCSEKKYGAWKKQYELDYAYIIDKIYGKEQFTKEFVLMKNDRKITPAWVENIDWSDYMNIKYKQVKKEDNDVIESNAVPIRKKLKDLH